MCVVVEFERGNEALELFYEFTESLYDNPSVSPLDIVELIEEMNSWIDMLYESEDIQAAIATKMRTE